MWFWLAIIGWLVAVAAWVTVVYLAYCVWDADRLLDDLRIERRRQELRQKELGKG